MKECRKSYSTITGFGCTEPILCLLLTSAGTYTGCSTVQPLMLPVAKIFLVAARLVHRWAEQ